MRVFLANVHCYDFIQNEADKLAPFVLQSFYDFQHDDTQESIERFMRMMQKNGIDRFLLDSGAYSFMNAARGRKVDFNAYLQAYINFINKYGVKYFFELDLDSVIGYEATIKMRNTLEQATGKKCIPVFHKSRGLQEWHNMCKEYDYVAIGTIYEYRQKESVLVQLLRIAKQYGTKVHGLGFTSCEKLKKVHFYSVDSTSWMSAGRYGQLHYFDGTQIQSLTREGRRIGDYKKATAHNFKEWVKYQQYAERFL